MIKGWGDTWIRITSPLALVILTLAGQQALLPPFSDARLELIGKTIFFIGVSFEACRWIVLRVRRKWPLPGDGNRRLVFSYLFSVAIMLLLITLSTLYAHAFMNRQSNLATESFSNLMQCLLLGFLVVTPYEVLYSYTLLRQSEQEREALLRADLQARLDTLKTQVNPHFLFNCLNTLSSLIVSSPARAEQYVLEMGTVYRHLLHSGREMLVPLSSELEFVHSYILLLETRFGTGLQVKISGLEEVQEKLLPPSALQMLLENAVKHNVVSAEQPLRIDVSLIDENRILVVNNLQKKIQSIRSEKSGLANIMSRYRLLKAPDVLVTESEESFSVILPLLNAEAYESIHRGR